MNVSLHAVDAKIPNLALMKLSAWHKSQGDTVDVYNGIFSYPDRLYLSKQFDFTPDAEYLPDCEIVSGGTGYDVHTRLSSVTDGSDLDEIMPDYDLFGCKVAMGRVTRGCPRGCPFCIVGKMDGKDVRQVAEVRDWYAGQDIIMLMDDNLTALPDVLIKTCNDLKTTGAKVSFETLDARLIDDEIACAVADVPLARQIGLSWDWATSSLERAVVESITAFGHNGLKPSKIVVYVLVGYNTTEDQDLYRIGRIRDLGADPYVMPFDKSDRYQRHLARWCNAKPLFKSVAWGQYSAERFAADAVRGLDSEWRYSKAANKDSKEPQDD